MQISRRLKLPAWVPALLFLPSAAPAGDAPHFVLSWGCPTVTPCSVEGGFDTPTGADTDRQGNVLIVDQRNNRIQKFDPDGNFQEELGSGFSGPWDVACGPSGDFFVSDQIFRIRKFDSSGNLILEWGSYGSGVNQMQNPRGLDVDADNSVYVADWGNHRIVKFSDAGTALLAFGIPGSGPGQFNNPRGVALDDEGSIYVADTGNHRIQKFSGDNFVTQWGSPGSGEGQFFQPYDVTVDSDGFVYVVDFGNNRIQKFDGSGFFIAQWGTAGIATGAFNSPRGITTSPDATGVYVVDSFNHRVQKFEQGVAVEATTWGWIKSLTAPILKVGD